MTYKKPNKKYSIVRWSNEGVNTRFSFMTIDQKSKVKVGVVIRLSIPVAPVPSPVSELLWRGLR